MEYPGKVVCEEIEYAAGDGTYSEEDLVKALLCGSKKPDEQARTMNLAPAFKPPMRVQRGQELYGRIDRVSETSATMTLGYELEGSIRLDISNDFAMMRIEGAKSPGVFLKMMRDVVHAGDIVKVEVTEMRKGGIDVAMKKSGLGVVKAFCTRCRDVLKLTKDNKLYCVKCNRTETRKLGHPYLEVME